MSNRRKFLQKPISENQIINNWTILKQVENNSKTAAFNKWSIKCPHGIEKVVTHNFIISRLKECNCIKSKYKEKNTEHFLTIQNSYLHPDKRQTYLECLCVCGKTTHIIASSFGKTKSCGCKNHRVYKSNEQFGHLKLIKKFTENKISKMTCECKCGTIKTYNTKDITRKQGVRSCGCSRYENLLDIYNILLKRIKHGAKLRNIEVCITENDLKELFEKQNGKCAISNEPIKIERNTKLNRATNTASIDRIDSSQGYIKNNIQFVHKIVNLMKQDYSQNDFIDWCNKISNFQKDKKDE